MSDDDKRFNEPKLAINRVYTRHGDAGHTRLVGGQSVHKSDPRLEAYGTVDELNAVVGACRVDIDESIPRASGDAKEKLERLGVTFLRVQHELFNLGSILATLPQDVHPKQPRPMQEDIDALERDMDACGEILAELRSFVLPGGCRLNADLHLARTVCRRAERAAVVLQQHGEPVDPLAIHYLNRLSDAFFVWSRYASVLLGVPEVLWQPNKSAAGL
jgi:cob(I)alamin adenosyltransferase